MLIAAIVLSTVVSGTPCGVAGSHHAMSLDMGQPSEVEPASLPDGLVVSVFWATGSMPELRVVDTHKPHANLLTWAPHGPDEYQLSAWTHERRYFPDLRRIPVRHHRLEVIADLRGVTTKPGSKDDDGSEDDFTGGAVEVCWRQTQKARDN